MKKHALVEHKNSFHQTLVALSYAGSSDSVDLFSRACVEQFEARPIGTYGYLFAQVFEPHVLNEIARLEGQEPDLLASMEFGESSALTTLRDEIGSMKDMKPVQAVNLAAALLSISRIGLANQILDSIPTSRQKSRDYFEIEMLRFVIRNRRADAVGMNRALARMRSAIERGGIPNERQLDAASQAVVWHLKGELVSKDHFDWFRELGGLLSGSPKSVDSGALSSWYRAIAMLPAAHGDRDGTRGLMKKAEATADESINARPRAYELHFRKTYFESTLKEHMYVTGDRDAAEEVGKQLIELDPSWAPSYGEVAEASERFGNHLAAAEMFERAGRLGPPYVGHHLFNSARCWQAAGNLEKALGIFLELFEFDAANPSVVVSAYKLASNLGDRTLHDLENALQRIQPELSPTHRAFLAA